MELTTENGILEELLVASKGDNWTTLLGGSNGGNELYEIFPNGWNYESCFDQNQEDLTLTSSNFSSLLGYNNNTSISQSFAFPFGEPYPFSDGNFTIPEFDYNDMPQEAGIQVQEEYDHEGIHLQENGQLFGLVGNGLEQLEQQHVNSRTDAFTEKKSSKVKKVEGQPSKNLMAERRRRKRLNDRLSMLRSIVPKISKMDRTSILGDTIDYMKELLDKIQKLQTENAEEHKELKPSEALSRNPPKFDVERRNLDTRIEICCATKPGLLLSTVSTLEALGLDIQQCVISSFSDFSLQASCSEVVEHRGIISSEDVKQALFRNAGYGGRCL
ncbi:hypothetical protein M9H77_05624 [Catharanthus roseus]|uniref:Uncharacterized protein n=1 Tax=Catharanthus roseus TaxID=4058 RepID=A0ACC0CHF0_CATRO|nr:hypothetical protein M9H77_05624 [Catharanthus roseus]